jgi:hypothetical protein
VQVGPVSFLHWAPSLIGKAEHMSQAILRQLLLTIVSVSALYAQNMQQQVQNLRAFSKAYGYVKYFHPSDEAATVDWDRFAAYGCEQVRSAKNLDELRAILNDLFLPLGPTLRIHLSKDSVAMPKVHFQDEKDLVAWQHFGDGVDTERKNSVYSSVRTNRASGLPEPSFFPAALIIPAKDYVGREFKFSAAVKTAGLADHGSAHLWFRVDRGDGSVAFFDNMDSRPIVATTWKGYEITGDIAADATNLVFGAMLKGSGRAWFDDVKLTYRKEGQWIEIPLPDGGFEGGKEGSAPSGWAIKDSPNYQCQVVKDSAASGGNSMLIHGRGNRPSGMIFEVLPKAGEVLTKELIPGLDISFPLTLPTAGWGGSDKQVAALEALHTDLLGRPKADAEQESVRLGNIVIAWNVFQHFYPYFDVVKVDWDNALTSAIQESLKDTTAQEHSTTLRRLVAKLQDGHGVVYFPDPKAGDLPARFDWIEDNLTVTATQDDKVFQKGDVILSVNGTTGAELLKKTESMVSGSDQLRRHRALNVVGYGPIGEMAKIEVLRRGTKIQVEVKWTKPMGNLFFKPLYEFNHPDFKDLGNGIYYLNRFALEKTKFKELLPVLSAAKGLIVDQRPMGYAKEPFDLIDLIPYLSKENYTSARWNIPQIIYPDHKGVTFKESRWPPREPQEPHLRARVLVINVPSVVSYGESVMGIYEHYKLAEFVGEPTAGCNGNANFNNLPGGFRMMWTGMKVLKHDGSQHHLIGIQPTYPVKRTLKAVLEGRDEYLEKAVELMNGTHD